MVHFIGSSCSKVTVFVSLDTSMQWRNSAVMATIDPTRRIIAT